MVGLWRLHRHKVTKLTDIKDYADIRTAAVLVILDTVVAAFQKSDVFVLDAIDFQRFHPAFLVPTYGKGFPLFPVPPYGADFPLFPVPTIRHGLSAWERQADQRG